MFIKESVKAIPKKKQYKKNDDDFCYRCGKQGHWSHLCRERILRLISSMNQIL